MERRHFLRLIGELAGLLALPAPALARTPRSVLLQVSPVAGFQYHQGERLWASLAEGDALTLIRETDNRYKSRVRDTANGLIWKGDIRLHKVRFSWRCPGASRGPGTACGRGQEGKMKLASFEAIVRALNDAGVRYLVAGGLAVNAHGYLRFTKDVDFVVQLVPDSGSLCLDSGADPDEGSRGAPRGQDRRRILAHEARRRCPRLNSRQTASTGA